MPSMAGIGVDAGFAGKPLGGISGPRGTGPAKGDIPEFGAALLGSVVQPAASAPGGNIAGAGGAGKCALQGTPGNATPRAVGPARLEKKIPDEVTAKSEAIAGVFVNPTSVAGFMPREEAAATTPEPPARRLGAQVAMPVASATLPAGVLREPDGAQRTPPPVGAAGKQIQQIEIDASAAFGDGTASARTGSSSGLAAATPHIEKEADPSLPFKVMATASAPVSSKISMPAPSGPGQPGIPSAQMKVKGSFNPEAGERGLGAQSRDGLEPGTQVDGFGASEEGLAVQPRDRAAGTQPLLNRELPSAPLSAAETRTESSAAKNGEPGLRPSGGAVEGRSPSLPEDAAKPSTAGLPVFPAAHSVSPATIKPGARIPIAAPALGAGAAVVRGSAVAVAASVSPGAVARDSGASVAGGGSNPSFDPGSSIAASGRPGVSSAGDLFNQIDAGETGSPQRVRAGPRSMEIGVDDPTHGWLEIRAEGGTGQVAASLTAASAGAHAALHAQLSGMAGYLAEHEIGVRHLTMSDGPGEAAAGSGERSPRQGGQPGHEGSGQDPGGQDRLGNLANSTASGGTATGGSSGPVARIGVLRGGGGELPRISAGDGPPHLVNVRA
jgi:hypothetical protein